MPSLPATDEGGGRPLTEDPNTGSDDGEDIAWDADTAEAGEVPAAAGTISGARPAGTASGTHPADAVSGTSPAGASPAGAEPRDGDASAGPEVAGPDGEEEFTEADVAFLSAPQEANATVPANGTVTEDAPGPHAAPAIGESGRWFRPATAKKKYVPIQPEDQDGSAGVDVAPADPEPDGAGATEDPAEQAAEPAASTPSGPAEAQAQAQAQAEAEAEAEAEAGADGDAPAADWASREQPAWVSPQQGRPAEVWTPPYQAAGRAGSAAGRMRALLRPGGAALASPPEGPVLAPSPEGPVLAPLPDGPVLAPGGRRLSRRRTLQAGLIGGAGVAALPLLAPVGGITRTDKQAAGLAFSMNTNWLFGGRYTADSETSSYDDSNFAPVTLFGLNRHQLYPYAGMAMGARAQRKDAEILKNEFNCNMVRCSHYPQSPDFLDACDELGLLVWEEAPGWHNVSTMAAWQDAVVRDVRDMVIRDRSRPSVIIWGTRLNECKNFTRLWAATRQAARELDSTRPSSGAMAFHEDGTWKEDVFAYNDYGTEDKTGNVALKPPFPGLPYMVSEAVGVEAVRPQHFAWTDPPGWLARQAAMHGQAQSQARSNPGYAGLLAWAGFDYGSLLGPGPYDIKWAGVADGFRVPKPGAAIYQAQGDPAVRPVIVPVFFWEAAGAVPALDQIAMIASNCERLEVFIGGTRVASAQPATSSPLYGGLAHPPFLVRLPKRLPKPPPDLLIRGFAGGRPVAQVRMSAHPGGDALAMAVDDTTISADGSDATRVVFRAIDAFGNQRRYRSGQVALTLSGPATLLGDNPFEFGQYGGLGAVWIRSRAGQPGAITLTASHPLLGQAEVQVGSAAVNNTSELG